MMMTGEPNFSEKDIFQMCRSLFSHQIGLGMHLLQINFVIQSLGHIPDNQSHCIES
jgi:hypothetical protein